MIYRPDYSSEYSPAARTFEITLRAKGTPESQLNKLNSASRQGIDGNKWSDWMTLVKMWYE